MQRPMLERTISQNQKSYLHSSVPSWTLYRQHVVKDEFEAVSGGYVGQCASIQGRKRAKTPLSRSRWIRTRTTGQGVHKIPNRTQDLAYYDEGHDVDAQLG